MFYNIKKYKNYGIITPLPTSEISILLDRELQYLKKNSQFMPNPAWGVRRFYNVKKGSFPWGLLNRVLKILDINNCEYEVLHSPLNVPLMSSNEVLRPYQLEAVNKLIECNGGVLSLPTGSGKTKTIIEYLKYLQRKSLVLVTTLDIKKQWEEQTKDYNFIKIMNYQNKSCQELVRQADVVVCDESHHASAKTIFNLLKTVNDNTIVVGISATPTRTDGEEMRLEAALGQIVYSIDRKTLIEQGYLSNAVIRYVELDYPVEKYLTYAEEYKRYIVENDLRNNMIAQIINEQIVIGNKTLVLITHIEHGERLMKYFDSSVRVIFLHGGVEDRTINIEEVDVIIASSVLNEGVDVPSLDTLIIAGGGSSEILLTQKVGRVLRKSKDKEKALIIDFLDKGKYIGLHSRKRRKLLEAEFNYE